MSTPDFSPLSPDDAPQSRWRPWHALVLVALVAATALILVRHNNDSTDPGTFHREEGAVFGTFYHVTYQAPASLHDAIEAELLRVDSSLSMFNAASNISRINRNETQAADTMLREVLALSLRVSDITGGAFDVTVAPLVNAWGFGYKNGTLPDSATVDSLRALVGYRQLHLTYDGTLTKDDPRIILDCSAVAKGYGVDRVAALLHSRGVNNFMVEIGGEIVVSGNNPKGEQWRVGVNRPDDDPTSTGNAIETVLPLTDCALATSGNYRIYYVTDDGRRVSHTINPATGYPARHSLLSATVIAPTCAEADAFATAFMVMGIDSAKALLPTLPYLQVYFIYDNDGRNAVFSTIPNN